jgi:hypothetical protein
MAFSEKITIEQLTFLAAYNKAHNQNTYVHHKGISAAFVRVIEGEPNAIVLQSANDDIFYANIADITITLAL